MKNRQICMQCKQLCGGEPPIAYFCLTDNKRGDAEAIAVSDKRISTRCPYKLEHMIMEQLYNKEICKECLKKQGRKWGKKEETRWNSGHWFPCFVSEDGALMMTKMDKPPADWCSYRLEHLVIEQKDE